MVHCFQKTGLEETTFDRVLCVVAELATVEGAAKIHASQVWPVIGVFDGYCVSTDCVPGGGLVVSI